MCISIFYAQVMGIWLALLGLAMVLHEARFKKMFHEVLTDGSATIVAGLFNLALGLVIVITHNIWVSNWPALITILGWFLIVQGVMRLFAPQSFAKILKSLFDHSGYTWVSWIWIAIGLYLIWVGFIG